MNILAVEDEYVMLQSLELAIRIAEPMADVRCFRRAEEVLAWDGAADVDVAFLDVQLPGMRGTTLARRLTDENPRLNVVFATGFSEYAGDAMAMHASGFITKPVTSEKVRRELDNLRHPLPEAQPKLRAHCFGNFEAYVGDEPLRTNGTLMLEILAYLVDRRGARCSVGEIESVLYEDKPHAEWMRGNLRKYVLRLSRVLAEQGCNDVLVRSRGMVGLNVNRVECDYWDYLDGKPGAQRLFTGEYMTQYSWAETTLANLTLFSPRVR